MKYFTKYVVLDFITCLRIFFKKTQFTCHKIPIYIVSIYLLQTLQNCQNGCLIENKKYINTFHIRAC